MSVITNTFTTYEAIGQREDLTDIISNIDPVDTPFFSNIGKGDCDAKFHEWQQDSLVAPDTANAQLEGDDIATWDAVVPTARIGNYCQISRKTVIISETEEEVDKAGRDDEMSYQIAKKGKELRRDMESIFLTNQAANAGALGTARVLGSMGAWVKTNTVLDATSGTDPVYTSVPTDPRNDSSATVTFTEVMLKDVCQQGWTSGAHFSILSVGAFNKGKVSTFEGIADTVYNINKPGDKVAVIGAVDVYVNDFHTLNVVPNRFQRGRDAWLLDPSLISVRYLRKFKTKKLGETGDNSKRLMTVEYTLRVENEKGLGGVFDLTVA